ncbi:MAG TPA: hypothetical protein VK178_10860 [Opitutaceae bacterium]|nr:hypothetical protein [Opitutaceae bacterium]HLP26005.1 hypothetical protein [Acidobacteriota bacterium]
MKTNPSELVRAEGIEPSSQAWEANALFLIFNGLQISVAISVATLA